MISTPLKFVNHRIEEYAMQVTLDPKEGTGTVVYNLSLIHENEYNTALNVIRDTCRAGIAPSHLLGIKNPGEIINGFIIPPHMIGLITLCSTTLDGLLIRRGIPHNPIGGGVVEIVDNIPRRFTHLIRYECTTIDPLQVLISEKTTSVTKVMETGSGSALANIRECHMEAEPVIEEILDDFSNTIFSGILDVGLPNTPSLGVTVSPQYMGIVTLGGTNQMAAIRERGCEIDIRAMKGVIDIRELDSVERL